jgi:hypothetical protein
MHGVPGNVMTIEIEFAARPLAAAPDDVTALARHWQGLRGAYKYPSRRAINPAELRPFLGYLCILDVKDNPPDFIHRLFGSHLVKYLQRDLTGKSVLELPSLALGQSLFKQLEDTIEAGTPMYFRTEVTSYDSLARKSGTSRLLLPLSDDGETINRLLTYTRFDEAPLDFWFRIAG